MAEQIRTPENIEPQWNSFQNEVISADIDLEDTKETLLQKVKHRLEASEKARKDKMRIWEKNQKYFEGKHWEISGDKVPYYQAKIVVNKWFSAIRNLIAFETDAKPETEIEVQIDPKDPNADILWGKAKKVDTCLDYNWDLLNVQNSVTEILYDRYNFADGFGIYSWDDETDNVNFEQIKPQELLVSPGATSIEDAEYVILSRYKNKKWFDKYYPEADITYENKRDTLNPTLDTTQYFNMAKVHYYFEDEIWVIFTDKEVLEVMPNPYWEFRSETEQREEIEKQIGQIPTDWQPIKNHLRKPEKPIIHFKGYHIGGNLYSEDLATQAMQLNMAFNKRKCQIADNADSMGNGQWVIDRSMPEEEVRKITAQPGLKVRINPQLARKEMGISLPEFIFADMQHTEQKFDDILGHHDVSKGAASSKRQTKMEVLLLKESDITPVRLMMRNTEMAETKLLNGWVQLMKLFYDIPHYVGSFGKADKSELRTTISRNDIPDNLSIIIKVGSTIPISMEARRASYERWAMSGLMDLKTFYEKMGEANPEKLANRAMNARMGVLSDNPPQPPMPQIGGK